MKFLSTFGKLPGTTVNLILVVIAGLSEGLGLAMFVPLLQMIASENSDDGSQLFSLIGPAFERIGLDSGPTTLMAAVAALVLGSLLLSFIQRRFLARAKLQFVHDMRRRVVDGLLRARWEYSSSQAHGEILNKLVMECSRAGNALSYELMGVATMLLIGIYLAFSIIISWPLMLVVLAFGAIMWISLRPLTRAARLLGEESNEANRTLALYSVDYLRSLKLVKATATENSISDRLDDRNDETFRVMYGSETNLAAVHFLVQAMAAVLLISIIGTSHFVFSTPPELLFVFLIFMVRMAPRIAQFQQQYQSYAMASPAWQLINDTLAESNQMVEPLNAGGVRFNKLTNAISLDHVSYRYPQGDTAATVDLSVTIPRKQMVAIVGSSGAGKSTLIDLIAGLRLPDSGQVLIDGLDLREMDLASFRRCIGFVSQDTIIFNDTLRNNLLFLRPDAPTAVVDHALSVAQLNEMVASMADGLDTLLGEGGSRLSGGQKQRVALARALILEPELLLLDEATSALDNESERAVQKAIEKIAHKMTIIVIAHRFSTIRKADVIYVIEAGRIVEYGSYDELLARDGRFSVLHNSQFA